ncbi:unnamed protein product [Amoebophrya sp. A120]|nr:unnamed protein product [Amoebophrya sp. A120]|eukprot:GSA120T00019413001.1
MRLDTSILRYLTKEDFRVLTSIEMGQKNHEFVPTTLIEAISNLRRGGCRKVLSLLLKHKLVVHDGKKYDGYKLTYNGYDFLALKTFLSRNLIDDVQMTRIGVGKEADVHVCYDQNGKKLALKLHRLGRISFRSIKNNRDYLQHRKHASWMYLSRLAATKEYAYSKALFDAGFNVPKAIDHNRHAILMEFVDAFPLYQMRMLNRPEKVMSSLFRLLLRLAKAGIIHGDFNEFNLMIDTNEKITLIDFPQIVTMEHTNADFYFERDVNCVLRFFRKRFNLECEEFPTFEDAKQMYEELQLENSGGCGSTKDHADDESFSSSMMSGNINRPGSSSTKIQLSAGGLLESENMLLLETIQENNEEDFCEDEEDDDEAEVQAESEDAEDLVEAEDNSADEAAGSDEEEEGVETAEGKQNQDNLNDDDIEAMYERMARLELAEENVNAAELNGIINVKATTSSRQKCSRPQDLNASTCASSVSEDREEASESSESESESENEDRAANGEMNTKNPGIVQDQIHVLQRKKVQRKVLTADEVKNKLKQKEKQQKFKNCNKNKMQRKMKNDATQACKEMGGF